MNLNEKIAKELYGSKSGDFAQRGNNSANIIQTYYPARKKAAPRKYYEQYLKVGGKKFWK